MSVATKEPIFGLTLARLEELAGRHGLPRYAGRQLAGWLYGKNAHAFDLMTDLSARARRDLAETCTIDVAPPLQHRESRDGTRKYLFPAGEGRFVEAAYIPEERRSTLCLSVQVGCKMGCLFCMTGRQGFAGNLTPGEILNQYRSLPEREGISNIVYMGMGEPLDNLDSVLESLEVFTSPWGYGLSPRRITVSTVGLLPALETFLERASCRLALSLHTPFEEERRHLMPVENVHPLEEVLQVIRRHPPEGQRRVSFEYILFRGFNHSAAHARELARLLQGIRARVNLIPFHPIPGTPLQPCSLEEMEEFQNRLKDKGVLATLRRSRGLDIQAACGLLSTRELLRQGASGGAVQGAAERAGDSTP
jgi:23S rRNA (adenine2503-C2)-methyltransferase